MIEFIVSMRLILFFNIRISAQELFIAKWEKSLAPELTKYFDAVEHLGITIKETRKFVHTKVIIFFSRDNQRKGDFIVPLNFKIFKYG